jgi:hypothetical protein
VLTSGPLTSAEARYLPGIDFEALFDELDVPEPQSGVDHAGVSWGFGVSMGILDRFGWLMLKTS